jgi:hypothetical protein
MLSVPRGGGACPMEPDPAEGREGLPRPEPLRLSMRWRGLGIADRKARTTKLKSPSVEIPRPAMRIPRTPQGMPPTAEGKLRTVSPASGAIRRQQPEHDPPKPNLYQNSESSQAE